MKQGWDVHYSRVQWDRQKKFPKDRICFRHGEEVANFDKSIFREYMEGRISVEHACEQIAENNYLFEVTEEQFFNELLICGWR